MEKKIRPNESLSEREKAAGCDWFNYSIEIDPEVARRFKLTTELSPDGKRLVLNGSKVSGSASD